MNGVTIFKQLYKSSDVPYFVSLATVVERIKIGKSKTTIDTIRQMVQSGADKKAIDPYKRTLPCILFSGKFNTRSKVGLVQHSGLICFDLDDLENPQEIKNELRENPHVVTAFISPSGRGVKFIVKIPPCDDKNHALYFKAFERENSHLKIDPSGKDICRVCFESYDPEIWVNENAITFEPQILDEGFKNSEKVPILPISDEQIIIEKIKAFNWNKTVIEGQRNAFIFDFAGMLCEYGVGEYNAINECLQYVSNDFTKKEIETTVKSAYKRRNFGTKYFEDYSKLQNIMAEMGRSKSDVIAKYGIDVKTYEEIKNEVETANFWTVAEDKNGNKKIKVDLLKFKLFLESNGFKKYYPFGATEPIFVHVRSNRVQETSPDKIKDFVLNYILEQKKETQVWSYFANYSGLFSENMLNMIETIELKILKDTKEMSYFAFENGILEVSKISQKNLEYVDIDYFIWENQIIKRAFTPLENCKNDYQKFIFNISKKQPEAFETAIGYLLNSFKNKINNKSIILNDEVISDNPEGGTGKGLFVQGIQKFRNVATIDGKTFSEKKSFPYQTVSQDTHVLVFDDVAKSFNFENIFSVITEGITLERKNKDAIKLSVEESPKILITTNYAIKGSGNSNERRRHELELAQYYNGKHTPYDDFQRQIFDDWSMEDYQAFDNYMIKCVQLYLQLGLIEQSNAINIKTRQFIADTSSEFYSYMNEDFKRYNERIDKKEAMAHFVEVYPDYSAKWFTQKRFTTWLEKWARFSGKEFLQNQSNGIHYFELNSINPFENDF